MTSVRQRARVRAPELTGRGGWIGTGDRDLSLASLRGKIVLLDFWTFCCINCLHVLEELRPLEGKYADVLVTVGVHSPKFVHEADHDAVVAAVERYGVHHPVLDDPDLTTWQAYAVRAWPTLTLVDPEGYVVAQLSGEGHAHALDALLAELVAEHEAKGTLHRGDGPYVAPPPPATALRFPSKAVHLPDGTWLVADTGGRRLVVLADDLGTVVRVVDGPFVEPQGLCLLPAGVAREVGYDVVVADTAGHVLRGVRLADGDVRVVAGSGRQWMQGSGAEDLSSPWDVAWHDGRVVVAMAGIHQLWSFDPRSGALERTAGTTNEGLRDGPADAAWLAQTSGLAAARDGSLWFVDSETSSLRLLAGGAVRTAVGTGLFDFGHRDGPADRALLQHPLGLAALPDGSVAIADTYNGAVRRYDPAASAVTTLAAGLAEPSDVVVDGDTLVVVESAAHRLTRVPIPAEAQVVDGVAHRTRRPVTELAPGPVRLDVAFVPPPGQHLDERYGPATRLVVTATPPALLCRGEGRGAGLRRDLVLDPAVGDGVLHVAAMAASCDDAGENAACHVHQQDWGVPVRLVDGAPAVLELALSSRR